MREFPLPQEILKVFQRQPGKTFRLRELVVELGLRSSQARDLKNALKVLSRLHRVVYLKKNHFALASKVAQGSLSSSAAPPPDQDHRRFTPFIGQFEDHRKTAIENRQ